MESIRARAFLESVERGSFKAAADALGYTPSAVSQLVAALEKDLKLENTSNIEAAKALGTAIAKKAQDAGIKAVVFDRAGYIYKGRVAALAEAAREAGLDF